MVSGILKKSQEKQADLRKAACLLRFRTVNPDLKSHKYLSYAKIASILCISINSV